MEDKAEIYETLRFIVSTHRSEFEKRRSYQWKAIAGIITVMALMAAARVTEKTSAIVSTIPDKLVWACLLVIAIVGSAFLCYVHIANAVNKTIAHRAENALQESLNGNDIRPLDLYSNLPKKPTLSGLFSVGNGGFWGWLFESIILLIFAVFSAIVITS
ncbi:hypothetical protein I6M46_15945 [Shewanella algae]|uniref:hypothetical protein n=1 Tax=Shewanella algae TaxID=38313 RepID=UPI001AAF67FE|nr:hypothetical protein [Shewanella algae]MBO2629753.1 hypothetical protein [Shewanella algae]